MKVQLDLEVMYKLVTLLYSSNNEEKRENDISFKIHTQLFPANSKILSQQSEILSKIISFSSTNIIALEDTNPDTFAIFLDYLHGKSVYFLSKYINRLYWNITIFLIFTHTQTNTLFYH